MEALMMTDKPGIQERYRGALGRGKQTDVVGAFGIADKRLTDGWVPTGPDGQGYDIPKAPLAVELERLFAGDNHAALAIAERLGHMAFEQSWVMRIKVTRPAAHDMAKAVLAWHRDGTCKGCGGHGYALIPGVPMRSDRECEPCGGSGKLPFDPQFTDNGRRPEVAQLARWMLGEMERAMGRAGPEAMKALAQRMEL
jgi:hypothetical protein